MNVDYTHSEARNLMPSLLFENSSPKSSGNDTYRFRRKEDGSKCGSHKKKSSDPGKKQLIFLMYFSV